MFIASFPFISTKVKNSPRWHFKIDKITLLHHESVKLCSQITSSKITYAMSDVVVAQWLHYWFVKLDYNQSIFIHKFWIWLTKILISFLFFVVVASASCQREIVAWLSPTAWCSAIIKSSYKYGQLVSESHNNCISNIIYQTKRTIVKLTSSNTHTSFLTSFFLSFIYLIIQLNNKTSTQHLLL